MSSGAYYASSPSISSAGAPSSPLSGYPTQQQQNNNNNNTANMNAAAVNTATSSTYRSKFSGMPGSASALHVHYGFKQSAPAFDPLPAEHPAAIARREVRTWAEGSRLGKQAEWNGDTCTTDTGGHPRRNLMHQLSEFQAPRIVHNFRAQEVPSIHKQAVPVWKSGKFKVDQTSFLSQKERAIAGRRVLGGTNVLSHAEMPITEDPVKQELEAGWSHSTALAHERASIFVKREEADYRALNRTKAILDHDRYVNPIDQAKRKVEEKRDEKRELRLKQEEYVTQMKHEARLRRGLKPNSLAAENNNYGGVTSGRRQLTTNQPQQVFKMSNIDTWWNASPPEVVEAVSVLQSRRQYEQEETDKRRKAEEEAARMSLPTNLRVVAPEGSQPSGR